MALLALIRLAAPNVRIAGRRPPVVGALVGLALLLPACGCTGESRQPAKPQAESEADSRPADSEPSETPREKPAQPHVAVQPREEHTLDMGDGLTMTFVSIPAGSFVMGSPANMPNADPCERPAHRVTISKPFFLGKPRVTQPQWQAIMGETPSHFRGATHPVDGVEWSDCQVFVAKMNEKFGGPRVRFSLPTEAQWEYACRAGTTTQYSFGDGEAALDEHAWWGKNAGGTTHPVGQKKPNPWGLYDMHGHLWQWCADCFEADYYERSPAVDPPGPASGVSHVLRGGQWNGYDVNFCRSAFRNSRPMHRSDNYGCRIVMTLRPDAPLGAGLGDTIER
jgi:formylglycine-generating enzyme required for sulfatase activity